MTLACTQQEAAERLNLTTRQIHNLVEVGLPTRSRRGKVVYPFPDCLTWYIQYKIDKAVEAVAPKDLDEAEKRKAIADAQLAELKLAKELRQVVTVEESARAVEVMLAQLRSTLLTVPQRYAPKVVGLKSIMEATGVLDALVVDTLTALSAPG